MRLFLFRADALARHNRTNLLIYNVAHQGIPLERVPAPKFEIDRRKVAERLLADAKEKLRLDPPIIDLGGYRDAISMSDYAILYAADAALATDDAEHWLARAQEFVAAMEAQIPPWLAEV